MAILSTTTVISNYLSNEYNLSGHISALAYKEILNAKEVNGLDEAISAVISVYPTATSSENGLMSYEDHNKLSNITQFKYLSQCDISDIIGYGLCAIEDKKICVDTDVISQKYHTHDSNDITDIDKFVRNDTPYLSICENSYASEMCAIAIGTDCSAFTFALAEGYKAMAQNYSVAIGKNVACQTMHAIVIGEGSDTKKTSGGGEIVIGQYAHGNAGGACQIGKGTNNETNSLQFINTKIVNSNGVIPNGSLELKSQNGLISSDGSGSFISINVDNNSISVINGQLSASGRVYTAGNGLKEDNGEFSITASYLTSNALNNVSSHWNDAWSRISAADNGLSDDLKELAYQDVSDLQTLSSVYIRNEVDGEKEEGYNNLSIIKLPLSSYELSVIDGTLSNNTLYVVDSDYLDMYGMQICALTMSDEETKKYEGIATTKPYVDEVKNTIIQYATQLSSEFNSTTPDFPKIANILSAMCVKLNEI